jgi:hypothetical protein
VIFTVLPHRVQPNFTPEPPIFSSETRKSLLQLLQRTSMQKPPADKTNLQMNKMKNRIKGDFAKTGCY